MNKQKKSGINLEKVPVFAILVIVVFIFMQTCGGKGHVTKTRKKLAVQVDSLSKENSQLKADLKEIKDLIITEDEMIELIKETPAWKTLRIEEISDKERISINALEEKETK